MKQYRFIGDPEMWAWEPKLVYGDVYPAIYSGYEHDGYSVTVEECAKDKSINGWQDWEEVTNDK